MVKPSPPGQASVTASVTGRWISRIRILKTYEC
jgi:hypothetical protein